jgi:hypothetical protein
LPRHGHRASLACRWISSIRPIDAGGAQAASGIGIEASDANVAGIADTFSLASKGKEAGTHDRQPRDHHDRGAIGVDGVDWPRAPLLALPPLVMVLFHLRGLYRTRLRALVLDGVVPVVSGVSGGRDGGRDARPVRQRARARPVRLGARRGCSRCSASASGAWSLARSALGARQAAGRQAGADHGRRRGRCAGGAPAGEPSRVRAGARRLPRRGSPLDRRGRAGATCRCWAPSRISTRRRAAPA